MICGIDEVGRGCLAGDVHACAVVFHSPPPSGLRDSKALSAIQRERLQSQIYASAHVGIGVATIAEIDGINILQAALLAMVRAFDALPARRVISRILVDGNQKPGINTEIPIECVIRGDSLHDAISAASIIAKVYRDRYMDELHREDPRYAWDRNKGYGSPVHMAALLKHGPSSYHRSTFAPVMRAAATHQF